MVADEVKHLGPGVILLKRPSSPDSESQQDKTNASSSWQHTLEPFSRRLPLFDCFHLTGKRIWKLRGALETTATGIARRVASPAFQDLLQPHQEDDHGATQPTVAGQRY